MHIINALFKLLFLLYSNVTKHFYIKDVLFLSFEFYDWVSIKAVCLQTSAVVNCNAWLRAFRGGAGITTNFWAQPYAYRFLNSRLVVKLQEQPNEGSMTLGGCSVQRKLHLLSLFAGHPWKPLLMKQINHFSQSICLWLHITDLEITYCPMLTNKSVPIPKTSFWYVKGTQFRSPLHQHSEKKVHQVMK